MSPIQTPYDESSWPKYKKPIVDKINAYYEEHIWKRQGNNVQDIIDDCQAAHDKYKKEFKWSLYYFICFCLPFSLILIVPFYWCLKKFKSMRAEKDGLKKVFDQKNDVRLKNVASIIHQINFYDLINDAFAEINYEHKGPLPRNFLSIIQKACPWYENNWILNTPIQNTGASSWGVFDKHMLILNVCKRMHWIGEKVYTATRSYTYTSRSSDGGTTVSTETLTARFAVPFPMYYNEYRVATFTTKAEKLKFSACYNEKEKFLKENYSQWKYTGLENPKFNKEFAIARNDEAAFRVFFTADTQEYFVNKLPLYENDGSNLPKYYWWVKKGPFVYSKYDIVRPFYVYNPDNYKFIYDVKLELQNVLNQCTSIMLEIIYERFLSLNCATTLPCLLTEYNNELIRKLEKNNEPSLEIAMEDDIYAQGIFTTIWNQPVIKSDAGIMNVMQTKTKERVGDLIITKVSAKAHGFKGNNLVQPVTVHGANTGTHVINVPYVQYVPIVAPFSMYYAKVKCFAFYENKGSDLGEMTEIFKKYGMEKRIKIKDDHIVYVYRDDSGYEEFKQIVATLNAYFAKNR